MCKLSYGYLLMRRHGLFLLLFCLLAGLPCESEAALRIDAPETVPQGSAFGIWVVSDEPDTFAQIRWRKKHVRVPLIHDGTTWKGSVMLPMPLEGDEPLTIQAKSNKATARIAVRPAPVAWKKQELQVEPKYVNPPDDQAARIKNESRTSRAVLDTVSPERYWHLPFVRPVPGDLSSHFGEQRVFNGEPRSRHRGVDLRGETGPPILAMSAGKVVIAADFYFSGNVVYIDHGQGVVSLYAHMSSIGVKTGDMVEAGQPIGLVGATGRVTGPHLHLGVNVLGFPVDPFSLLAMRADSVQEQPHE